MMRKFVYVLALAALAVGPAARGSDPVGGYLIVDKVVLQPTDNPKTYAVNYYMKYPALGLMVWPPLYYAVEGAWMSCFPMKGPTLGCLAIVSSACARSASGVWTAGICVPPRMTLAAVSWFDGTTTIAPR